VDWTATTTVRPASAKWDSDLDSVPLANFRFRSTVRRHEPVHLSTRSKQRSAHSRRPFLSSSVNPRSFLWPPPRLSSMQPRRRRRNSKSYSELKQRLFLRTFVQTPALEAQDAIHRFPIHLRHAVLIEAPGNPPHPVRRVLINDLSHLGHQRGGHPIGLPWSRKETYRLATLLHDSTLCLLMTS
jgi:hypothetical protein